MNSNQFHHKVAFLSTQICWGLGKKNIFFQNFTNINIDKPRLVGKKEQQQQKKY